ncbi:MAG: nucleotidyl transferase AbiEii/AbiGii toxin family protein [candidate division WOR-3 bacterium]
MKKNKNLLSRIGKALDKFGIDYMVIGGQAVLLYGEPRFTRDIDIVIGITPSKKEKIFDLVKELKLKIIVKNPEKFIKETYVLPCESSLDVMRVDFIFSDSEFEKNALKRVRVKKIDDCKVKFASIEDIIILKIVAGRERDLEDVYNILLKNKTVDYNYIYKSLKFFETILNTDLSSIFKNIVSRT